MPRTGTVAPGVRGCFSPAAEEAGGREAFVDAALYDYEYRRRRADLRFYRQLARNRMEFEPGGPILDLACGTGRLLVPLLRDGHTVVGLDRSPAMLARAARKVARLAPCRRQRCLLVKADLRAFAMAPRFALAVAVFHSVQHLMSIQRLARFLGAVRASLLPRGWLAFDVLPPHPSWLKRDPGRRWGRTVLRHPATGERLVYTMDQAYDSSRRALHMRIYYQPIDEAGCPAGPERIQRLCHQQLWPSEVEQVLVRAGFRLLASFAGFDGRPLRGDDPAADDHIYVATAR